MGKKKKIIVWMSQLICVSILFPAAYSKLTAGQEAVYIFTTLGMEPHGRIVIGLIELTCALFLLTHRFAAIGSFFTIGVMCGAIIAHCTVLGVNILGGGGKEMLMLGTVLISSLLITFIRRKEIPLIGNSME